LITRQRGIKLMAVYDQRLSCAGAFGIGLKVQKRHGPAVRWKLRSGDQFLVDIHVI
jgi:hypothetical protein